MNKLNAEQGTPPGVDAKKVVDLNAAELGYVAQTCLAFWIHFCENEDWDMFRLRLEHKHPTRTEQEITLMVDKAMDRLDNEIAALKQAHAFLVQAEHVRQKQEQERKQKGGGRP